VNLQVSGLRVILAARSIAFHNMATFSQPMGGVQWFPNALLDVELFLLAYGDLKYDPSYSLRVAINLLYLRCS
jgi:hypothetical protein